MEPGVDSDASMAQLWGETVEEEGVDQRMEHLAIDRSRFGFRSTSGSDAASLQSESLSSLRSPPFDSNRFAGLHRSHAGSDEHDEHLDVGYGARGYDERHDDEDEDDEEEEEDDDDVRRSWTTEKEPVHARYSGATGLASFRFRSEHHRENTEIEHEDEDHGEEEEEEEEEEEDRDSDASFASLEWVTKQLRQLERRERSSSADTANEDAPDKSADGRMEPHVREALRLLNGGGDEETVEDEAAWAKGAAERRGSYFDIVQEAMAVEWRRDDSYEVHDEDQQSEDDQHGDEHEEEEEEEEDQQEVQQSAPEDVADEWLEAFTAKGRVYYYNRRTRESSWTKPESLAPIDAIESAAQSQHDHEEHHDEHQALDHGDAEDQRLYQEPTADNGHDSRSRQSSTSSTSSSNHSKRHDSAAQPRERTADVLFCCFCGSQVDGASGFQSHAATCATLRRHKQSASPLYTQFQQMLVLLSEDMSLRSLHYASSFPDVKPHPLRDVSPTETQQSVRESLTLLRVKHRSSRKPLVHRAPERDERVPLFQPVPRLSLSSSASSKKTPKAPREPLATRYANMKQKPTPVAQLNMETCRHCSRSFAEGRLAKHEAVCLRVFGNENAWGRGPSTTAQRPSVASDLDASQTQQRQDHLLRSLKKKHQANLKHTLALSFQEHQASLVECPCCRRKFAPSGAQQHIDICKSVQHRPRNPVPLLKDFALAG